MKTFFRVSKVGLCVAVLGLMSVVIAVGQDEKEVLYGKITANYTGVDCSRENNNYNVGCFKSSAAKMKIAVDASKEYLQKFGSDSDDQVATWIRQNLPNFEARLKYDNAQVVALEEQAKKNARYSKFNNAFKANNYAETYQVGGEILRDEPNMIDVALVLGSIGFDQIVKSPPVDTYNDETIKYAKLSLSKMQNGAKSEKWGAFGIYEYDSKANAQGWMNYIIGMIMYHRKGATSPAAKKASLEYLYKSTQYDGDRKSEPRTYGSIADWYFDQALQLGKKRAAIAAQAKAKLDERNKPETTKEQADVIDKEIDALEAQIDSTLALEKGYVDRAIDGYARAYQFAKANPKETKAYKDGLMKTIRDLYNFRYQKPEEKTPTKINSYLAGVMSTPMPNPMSSVTPVVEAKPAENSEAKAGTR